MYRHIPLKDSLSPSTSALLLRFLHSPAPRAAEELPGAPPLRKRRERSHCKATKRLLHGCYIRALIRTGFSGKFYPEPKTQSLKRFRV